MTDPDCPMALLTQADFDGELDPGRAADLALHRAGCARCQAAYAELAAVHATMRDSDLYVSAPDSLRRFLAERSSSSHSASAPASISSDRPAPASAALTQDAGTRSARDSYRPASASAALTQDAGTRSALGWRRWRWPAASFGLGAALAAVLVVLMVGSAPPDMVGQVVDDHVRALQPGHLEDVVSTDRHTVKPWFEGRLDFAPPVKDLAAQQFPLLGGRLDALGGRPIAALIYKRNTHPINLLVWPATEPGTRTPVTVDRNGFTVVHWTQDGMTLYAISDVERAQLEEFVRLWQAAP